MTVTVEDVAKAVTVEKLLDLARSKGPDSTFDYYDNVNCPIGMLLKAAGIRASVAGTDIWLFDNEPGERWVDIPKDVCAIVSSNHNGHNSPWGVLAIGCTDYLYAMGLKT